MVLKIICNKCEYVIDRDKYIDGVLVEEYKNTFGTFCPKCNSLISPIKKPFFQEKKEMDMEILKEEMRDKLRKKGEL